MQQFSDAFKARVARRLVGPVNGDLKLYSNGD
jgi:hypothetical protein